MKRIQINLNESEHLTNLSCYDNNVYKLTKPVLGFSYVKVEYFESYNVWDATLGDASSGTFISAVTYEAHVKKGSILTIFTDSEIEQ